METKQPRSISKTVGKIFITLAVLVVISFGAYFAYTNIFSCTFPVKYAIGSVDSRFKITQDEVKNVAEDASSRWNQADSKDLLNFDPNAKLKINLIYDQRQEELDKLNSELDQIKSSKSNLDTQNEKFNNFLSSYQTRLDSYNAEVQKWNGQGGAPSDVFASLEAQRKDLAQMQTTLKQMADVFNVNAGSYNNDLGQLNTVLNQKKDEIVTKGEYNPSNSTIDIYTFGNEQELRLVLMHELGHGLGGDHISNDKAVMHDILDLEGLKNPRLTEDDLNDINETCSPRLNFNSSRYFGYLNRLLPNLK